MGVRVELIRRQLDLSVCCRGKKSVAMELRKLFFIRCAERIVQLPSRLVNSLGAVRLQDLRLAPSGEQITILAANRNASVFAEDYAGGNLPHVESVRLRSKRPAAFHRAEIRGDQLIRGLASSMAPL